LRRLIAATLAVLTCAFLAAACSGSPSGSAARTTAEHRAGPVVTSYYLALGDSLSVGIQPNADGSSLATPDGYANRLYAALRPAQPGLRLVKLGCSGETTYTMIRGGICHYAAGSQLRQAERFLRGHRRHMTLITIDIGANDPNSCYLDNPLSDLPKCMSLRVKQTVRDLNTILAGLRAAGGRQVRIIGMNYYVPELAGWFDGKDGQIVAVLSERLVHGYNILLAQTYHHYGARIANVFAAFHSADFTDHVHLPKLGTVPRNVATVCQLTWACAQYPRGPNEHANDTGYGIIALAFLLADQARG
jgi:lysophospholipase L1-like esterase